MTVTLETKLNYGNQFADYSDKLYILENLS